MDGTNEPVAGIAFGRFRVLPRRRELVADGQPVKLGGRAFDVLTARIEARGEILSKDALTRTLLGPVMIGFTERFDTDDLLAARTLLDALQECGGSARSGRLRLVASNGV